MEKSKKKSVYELTNREGKNLEQEFLDTSYGRNLFLIMFLAVLVPAFMCCISIIEHALDAVIDDVPFVFSQTEELLLVFTIAFAASLRLFWFNQLRIFHNDKNK